MKTQVHPKWHPEAQVSCACGAQFTTGSTTPKISVEVCSNCHPLWTGQQKFLDTAGRVEKFNQRVAMAEKKKAETATRRERKQQADAAAEAVPASV